MQCFIPRWVFWMILILNILNGFMPREKLPTLTIKWQYFTIEYWKSQFELSQSLHFNENLQCTADLRRNEIHKASQEQTARDVIYFAHAYLMSCDRSNSFTPSTPPRQNVCAVVLQRFNIKRQWRSYPLAPEPAEPVEQIVPLDPPRLNHKASMWPPFRKYPSIHTGTVRFAISYPLNQLNERKFVAVKKIEGI